LAAVKIGPIDPAKTIKDLQARADFILHADQHMAEVVGLLKETHEVLAKLNGVVDRALSMVDDVEERVGNIGTVLGRLDRLEEAALNIERATMGVENAMLALPKALRTRITRRSEKATDS
jgi:t-SNARE complex subunit (syntaxin)